MEDFPFDPSLRIPPLLDPQPSLSSRRGPTPLEPNARVNESSHNATVKLSSRTKALDEAKPIGEDETYNARVDSRANGETKVTVTTDGSRKRQKVDYFQLPKPTAKSSKDKPPPFKPVPVLNKLHQPPPSAALFPPITPNGPHETRQFEHDKRLASTRPQTEQSEQDSKATVTNENTKDGKSRAKRVCLRARLKWTESETEDLMKGVGIYGVGKWKKILHHPDLNFHPERTMVDLKDRYRTCRMNEEKAIERQAASDSQEHPESKPSPKKSKSRDRPRKDNSSSETPSQNEEQQSSSAETKVASPGTSSSSFSIFTPRNFSTKANGDAKGKKTTTSQPWTIEEDADLSKGYQKYGFQWTAIAKDKELCLGHRTGAQVRDRFRMKYPVVYQSSVPLPLPEVQKRPSRPRADRKLSVTGNAQEISTSKKPSSLTFIINEPATSRMKGPGNSTTTMALPSRSSQKTLNNVTSQTLSTVNSFDRFSGLDVQPLPEPGDPDGEDEYELDSSEVTSSDRSRQSTAEAEEARHLSILGLLNEDVEQNGRLPPFKYPFDDEWSNAGGDNVTLPPLHWEEMAARPIFDLE